MVTLYLRAFRVHRTGVFAAVSLLLALASCKDTTTVIVEPAPKQLDSIAIILNQGAFGTDNASLTRQDLKTRTTDVSWFSSANNNQKLGSTANDIAVKGDTAFVTVTESKTVEILNLKTGKSLGRMTFTEGKEKPYLIEIISPVLGVVSTNEGDGVRFFNPTTFQLLNAVKTGPATEGIAVVGTSLWVCNTGFGDLRANEPGAGTISVIDIASRAITRTIAVAPNVRTLARSSDGKKVYAFYQHLYSKPDSLQGIVEYDASTYAVLRSVRLSSGGMVGIVNNTLLCTDYNPATFSSSNVLAIDLAASGFTAKQFMAIPVGISSNGVSFNPLDNTYWFMNARDYKSNGEVVITSSSGVILRRFDVGVVPVGAIFF